jgi:hypothetical protein
LSRSATSAQRVSETFLAKHRATHRHRSGRRSVDPPDAGSASLPAAQRETRNSRKVSGLTSWMAAVEQISVQA